MIASFRDEWLRVFFKKDKPGARIPADLRDRLLRKLQMIDDAETEAELRVPPSNHLERLRGKLDGWLSIRVNQQWRLTFRWKNGDSVSLHLDDHSCRCRADPGRMKYEGMQMRATRPKPVAVGGILTEEFLTPLSMTPVELAEAAGLPRKHIYELCRDRRAVTADTALILARVVGNSAESWLKTQCRTDLWEAINSPERRERIDRARHLHSRESTSA